MNTSLSQWINDVYVLPLSTAAWRRHATGELAFFDGQAQAGSLGEEMKSGLGRGLLRVPGSPVASDAELHDKPFRDWEIVSLPSTEAVVAVGIV